MDALMNRDALNAVAQRVYEKYRRAFGNNLQGCCPLIADEIQREVGGDIVAGELTWYGGSCIRTHWWVEKGGIVLDPMGDWFLDGEPAAGRREVHRDRAIFDSVVFRYEQWRVGGGLDA